MTAPKGAGGGYYVTAKMLRKRHACEEQVGLFVRTFGHGRVRLTLANVRKAMAAGLDVGWVAQQPWVQHPGWDDDLRALVMEVHQADGDAKSLYAVLLKAPAAWAKVDAARAKAGVES